MKCLQPKRLSTLVYALTYIFRSRAYVNKIGHKFDVDVSLSANILRKSCVYENIKDIEDIFLCQSIPHTSSAKRGSSFRSESSSGSARRFPYATLPSPTPLVRGHSGMTFDHTFPMAMLVGNVPASVRFVID